MFKLMGKKIFTILRCNVLFILTCVTIYNSDKSNRNSNTNQTALINLKCGHIITDIGG